MGDIERIAKCSCGRLKVTCLGEPKKVSLCHCQACQRQTGAPFGIAAFYEQGQITVQGAFNSHERSSDAGHAVTTRFCPNCGATIFWHPERMPDLVAVAVGAFADPDFPAPQQEVHTEYRHPWVSPLKP